jgi:hypothetical protein
LKSFESIESLLQFTLCDIMDRVNIVDSPVSLALRFLIEYIFS